MKQRKNISKIALLAGLLMLNTTANSFYQCVPKKDWVEKIIKEKEDKNWKFVQDLKLLVNKDGATHSNIVLESGYSYKFTSFIGKYLILKLQYGNMCVYDQETKAIKCIKSRSNLQISNACSKSLIDDYTYCNVFIGEDFLGTISISPFAMSASGSVKKSKSIYITLKLYRQ